MRFLKLLPSLLISLIFVTSARASCGCASCPIDTHTSNDLEVGSARLEYSNQYIDQGQPRIGRREATVGEISGHHDEVSTLNQIQQISLDLAVAPRWSFQTILPFVHREHTHIHDPMGSAEIESWNFNGVGDVTVLGRYRLGGGVTLNRPSLSLIAGIVAPTGRKDATNSDGEEAEVTLQAGKGAWSEIAGFSLLQKVSAPSLTHAWVECPIFFSSTYQWNGKGHKDYRMGDVWLAHLGTVYPLLPKLGIITQLNFKVLRRDSPGDTDEEVEKTGGTFLYVSPGLQLQLSDALSTFALLQLPIYQRVNGIQLTSDYNLNFGAAYRFSLL